MTEHSAKKTPGWFFLLIAVLVVIVLYMLFRWVGE